MKYGVTLTWTHLPCLCPYLSFCSTRQLVNQTRKQRKYESQVAGHAGRVLELPTTHPSPHLVKYHLRRPILLHQAPLSIHLPHQPIQYLQHLPTDQKRRCTHRLLLPTHLKLRAILLVPPRTMYQDQYLSDTIDVYMLQQRRR